MNIKKSFKINVDINGFRFNLFFGVLLVTISLLIGFFPCGVKMIWIIQQVAIMFTGIMAVDILPRLKSWDSSTAHAI